VASEEKELLAQLEQQAEEFDLQVQFLYQNQVGKECHHPAIRSVYSHL
jgi:hypothetical protein